MDGFGQELILRYFYEGFADLTGDFVHELGGEVVDMLREGAVEFGYLLPIFEKLHVAFANREVA